MVNVFVMMGSSMMALISIVKAVILHAKPVKGQQKTMPVFHVVQMKE